MENSLIIIVFYNMKHRYVLTTQILQSDLLMHDWLQPKEHFAHNAVSTTQTSSLRTVSNIRSTLGWCVVVSYLKV